MKIVKRIAWLLLKVFIFAGLILVLGKAWILLVQWAWGTP